MRNERRKNGLIRFYARDYYKLYIPRVMLQLMKYTIGERICFDIEDKHIHIGFVNVKYNPQYSEFAYKTKYDHKKYCLTSRVPDIIKEFFKVNVNLAKLTFKIKNYEPLIEEGISWYKLVPTELINYKNVQWIEYEEKIRDYKELKKSAKKQQS